MLPTPTPHASFAEIAAVLRDPARRRFVVVSHLRPDGDALGSQIAFGLCLLALGKEVSVWNEDGMLDKLRFLPGSELVSRPPLEEEPREFDVLVALDTATHVRLGTPLRAIRGTPLVINLDHHVSNPRYGDLAHVDAESPATGQVLFEFFSSQGLPITVEMATNLFAAISTDTGSFQYASTTARTYEIAAELIRLGVDFSALSGQLYGSYPLRRLRLLQALLHTLKLTADDRVASFSLSLATARETGATPEDNEGLIDYIRSIDTVQAAVFFEEMADGLVRVSMRSKTPSVNVSAICARFGGGGHVLAAGARVRGTLVDVETRVLGAIHEVLLPAK